MFEVGKKYQSKHSLSVWDCLWDDGKFVLLRCGSGSPGVWYQKDFIAFREYHEPKVEKIKRFVWESGYSKDGYTTGAAGYELKEPIGSYELTFTDGKLTKVEIV